MNILENIKKYPDFEARRVAGIQAYWANHRHSAKSRAVMSEKQKAAWVKRRRKFGDTGAELSETERERRAAQLIINRAEFEARRVAIIKKVAKDPAVKAKKSMVARDLNDKRRGFKVPAKMWKEYKFLVDRKSLSAKEAGIILGLLPASRETDSAGAV